MWLHPISPESPLWVIPSLGVKKEKLITQLLKASAIHKAKYAAKKAMKIANKKNISTSSTAMAQQSTKLSRQKKKDANVQCASAPDIDASKAHIKELKGMSHLKLINMISMDNLLYISWYTHRFCYRMGKIFVSTNYSDYFKLNWCSQKYLTIF